MGAEDAMTSAPEEEVSDTVGSVVIQCEGEGLTVDDDEEEGCATEEAESVMGEEKEEEDEEEDGVADCESKLTLVGAESDQEVAVTLSSPSPPLPSPFLPSSLLFQYFSLCLSLSTFHILI